jgi:two-component system cell cycle sensor histidine kinase/response regulator CckA
VEQLIRILHLEDDAADAELVQALLEEAGMTCEITRVQTGEEFGAELHRGGYDLILADYRLPKYDGMAALRLVQELGLELPFIFVSGVMGEDAAVEGLTRGATDYVLKQKLTRLVPAVKRALGEAENRRERRRAEEARANLEEQLRQAQKMESIGLLAGRVAQDFNNLVTVIQGYCDLLESKLPARSPLLGDLRQIRLVSKHAATLTQQLQAFSRKQVMRPRPLNLNEVIAEMQNFVRRIMGKDVELFTLLDPALGVVKADPGLLRQVIMNLALNSREAMPRGGRLTIETENVDLDAAYARQHLEVTPGPYVMLTVNDTGIGMDTATQARIFEPFFTTKEPGAGTGLGLSTVYGIVKQSGGHIRVDSEPGQGATFKIYLPQVEETALPVQTAAAPAESLQGQETILVVEDDDSLRELIYQTLRSYGYKVLAAHHGSEAILQCARYKGPIHLVLTDELLPGMTGAELLERLAPLGLKAKALFMSGYTEDTAALEFLLTSGAPFIEKPFKPNALVSMVREVLDTPG